MIRFSIAGVPVRVQPVFFLMAALLGAGLAEQPRLLVAWLAVVFTGVLAHELGHAAAFRAFGHPCLIELHGFGGHTASQGRTRLSTWQDVAVSFAGPGTGLAIGALAGAFKAQPGLDPFTWNVLSLAEQVNWYWGLLNLLPILPMDGGQILRAGLLHAFPDRGATAAHAVSIGFCAVALAAALLLGRPFGAILCGMFGWSNLQQLRAIRAVGPDRQVRRRLEEGFRLLDSGDARGAEAVAREARGAAQRDTARREALHLLVAARLVSRDPEGALLALEEDRELARGEPLLRGLALQAAGRNADALVPLAEAFDTAPSANSGGALVQALIQCDDLAGAERLAHDSRAAALDEPTLERLQLHLLARGRPAPALLVAERHFDRSKSPEAAFNAARSCALLGDTGTAFKWLRRARDQGLVDFPARLASRDLNALAGRPELDALRG